jgi:hypothetical protein
MVLFSIEISLLFAYRAWKARKKAREQVQEGAWAILFLFWGIMWGCTIAGDYFVTSPAVRSELLSWGYFGMTLGLLFFVYNTERHITQTRPNLTYAYGIAVGFSFVLLFVPNPTLQVSIIDLPLVQWVTLVTLGSFLIVFAAFLIKINRKSRLESKYLALLLVGGLFFCSGFIGTMDFTSTWIGPFVIRSYGDYVGLTGLCLIALFLFIVPNFAEWDWAIHTKLFMLYEVKSGVVVFTHRFGQLPEDSENPDDPNIQELLMASALSGIREVLKQISEGSYGTSEPPNRIKQADKLVLLQYGDNFAAAAVCDRFLYTVVRLMKQVLDKVEQFYQGKMQYWDGDLNYFQPVREIFQSLFLRKN